MDKRFTWYDHLWINLFWLGLNIRNNAVGSLFLPFLVDMFVRSEVKNTALGVLRTAGLIVAMLVQPAAGLLSDRSTSRFGRRRPYILTGVLLDLVFLAGIYFAWNYISLVAALLLLQISSNISHGPLQALIPDLVPEDQRGVSSAIKAIFELIPLILVGFTIAKLVGLGHLDWAMLATGLSLLAIMLLTLLLVKEPPLLEKPDAPFGPPMLRVLGMIGGILIGALAGLAGGGLVGLVIGLAVWLLDGLSSALIAGVGIGGLVAMIVTIITGVWAGVSITIGKHNDSHPVKIPFLGEARRPFSWWVINRLFFLAAITSIQGSAPYFLMYAFQINREAATNLTGQLMTMVGIFTLIATLFLVLARAAFGILKLPMQTYSSWFDHKRIISISGIAAGLGSFLLLGTIWMPNLNLIYLAGIILGLSTGLFMSANWALGTDLVPPSEAGRYMGVSNLAGAGAGMIGGIIGGPLADYMNLFLPGLGYFEIFACYGVLFVLSALSLRGIRSIARPPVRPVVVPAEAA